MDQTNETPRRRTSLIAVTIATAVGAVVVGGLIAAKNMSKTVQANLPAAEQVTTTEASAAAAPLAGKGAPISVSGTSPITGKRVSLAAITGKPVVLTIWASWCPGCNQEAPHLAKIAARRTDVHFFGIDYRDNAADARGFYAKYAWRTLPSVEDPGGSISLGLGLQGTPTTIFLDARHREVGRVSGAMDEAGLNDAIDQLVGA